MPEVVIDAIKVGDIPWVRCFGLSLPVAAGLN
jgi:hypothetical protein